MNRIDEIREKLPALSQSVYGKRLVYLDNAATSQKPKEVIELVNRMNSGLNGNIHRAVHKLSADATELYENARESVRKYINAAEREEIVFTSGTTASINLIASSFGEKYLKKGDSVLISEAEHHSNLVPWQMVCERRGAVLKTFSVNDNGEWDMDSFDRQLDGGVKLVAVAHISNVLGVRNPIEEVIRKGHAVGAQVLIDGAQGVVHDNVDVQALDADYYVFSAHKIYGATGTGILYGKRALLEELPPYMGGGDMVGTVTLQKTTYAPLPLKFEAGTPNFIAAATYTSALSFAEELRSLSENEKAITSFIVQELSKIEGLKVYGKGDNKIPLFSFTVEGAHHSDLAMILDKMGIAIRSGQMCAEPLMARFGVTGMLRASFAPYNTLQEAEYFISSLQKAILMLR